MTTTPSPYHHPSDDIPLHPQPLTELEQFKLAHRMTRLNSIYTLIGGGTKQLFQELTNIHNKEQWINESNYRAIYRKNIEAVREGHQQAQARYTHPITISRIQQLCKDLDVRFEESDFKDYVNHKIQSQVVKRYSMKTFEDIIEDSDVDWWYNWNSCSSQIAINNRTATNNILSVFHEFSHAVQQYITTMTTKNNIFMQKLQQTFWKKILLIKCYTTIFMELYL